jgi:SAM-dependent methyltransferase
MRPDLPFSPAAVRNAGPILAVLQPLLGEQARVLEIASGTGQHAALFGAAQPGWHWQPSDVDALLLPAIAARCAGLANVQSPLLLDVLAPDWPVAPASRDAVLCANLLHIAPWPVCAALMAGVARVLRAGGVLLLYGPYRVDGEPLAAGNLAFDADLRRRNPAWGQRRLADVQDQALQAGLRLERQLEMPANNLSLVFRSSAQG